MGSASVRFSGARVLFFFKNFKKKKKKKNIIFFFQNRFKKVITFPKRHADNFLEIFTIVKTSYAFWSWICLWRFFDKIWEQEYFFREQECFFFFKNLKKKKKKKIIIFFFQNRFKKVITFPKWHADNFLEISPIVKTPYAFWSWICLWRFFDKIRKIPAEGMDPSSYSYKNPYCLEVLAVGSSIPPDGIDFFFFKKKAVAYRSLNL